LQDYQTCLEEEECGTVPTVRLPLTQETRIQIWYTTELTAYPYYDGPPNYDMLFPIQTYYGSDEMFFSLMHDFGTTPLSYCIIAQTVIKYDDGTCCGFTNAACFDKG